MFYCNYNDNDLQVLLELVTDNISTGEKRIILKEWEEFASKSRSDIDIFVKTQEKVVKTRLKVEIRKSPIDFKIMPVLRFAIQTNDASVLEEFFVRKIYFDFCDKDETIARRTWETIIQKSLKRMETKQK